MAIKEENTETPAIDKLISELERTIAGLPSLEIHYLERLLKSAFEEIRTELQKETK